ncbi:MAG TPA: SET domain-containing protein-lysine N-methyltransferase [Steroidobacteraceae bacterium]
MKTGRRPPTPLFEVRHSRVHGHGVFALRRIRKGTNIIEYLGERVSPELADTRYAGKHAQDGHTFLFTVDSKTVIDAGVDGNDARFVNHGCDPNCQTVQTDSRIFIEALRTIRPGEELAYDYRLKRDADDPADIDRVFRCLCGAKNCRGTMLEAPSKKRATQPAKQRQRRKPTR